MALLRRWEGFRRYALAIQYHGTSFLGVTYLGRDQEDCLVIEKKKTKKNNDEEQTTMRIAADLRGYRTIEGRIREALDDIFSEDGWENFQISSRTDRGVHALKNTFHVDIHVGDTSTEDSTFNNGKILQKLRKGLNYQLARQTTSWSQEQQQQAQTTTIRRRKGSKQYFTIFEEDDWRRHSISDELKILAAKPAPDMMYNPFSEDDPSQPTQVDWNARFSATQRTYIYRILTYRDGGNDDDDMEGVWGIPFEWDRSWRLRFPLNVEAMQRASKFLEGNHDFSSFRGANCQRQSPVVDIQSIHIQSRPYGPATMLWGDPSIGGDTGGGLLGLGEGDLDSFPQLITISIVGNAFLYRQVRNMVGCLVEVGRGRLRPDEVYDLLSAKDRRLAPPMAPANGLFLVNVQHGDFLI